MNETGHIARDYIGGYPRLRIEALTLLDRQKDFLKPDITGREMEDFAAAIESFVTDLLDEQIKRTLRAERAARSDA